ncbi:MAG: TonB-dependent receptor domain-containing protein [Janthinobacterium lividum]
MKHLVALMLFFLLAFTNHAQTPTKGTATLRGSVQDAATKKPVEFATVMLLSATGTAALAGATCDEQGRFELKNLAPGSFRVQVSFVGYTTRLDTVRVAAQATDLGVLSLKAAAQKLGEVTVTGQRPLVESKPDRLVYNAEQDATNAGGTAADVLRKTPLLSLDGDGNPQLRGTSNVRILVNNKPSAMLAGNLADALKQIPADQIKAIEVITSPSAKYDAEGSGGVINIVLKKGLQGTNGNVGANVGNRNQGLNGSLNTRRGKLGINTRLNGYYNTSRYESRLSRTDFSPLSTGYFAQTSASEGENYGGYGQVELTYDPSPLHSFTASANGNTYQSDSPQNLFNQYLGQGLGQPGRDTLYARDINQKYLGRNYDFNAGYTRTFGPEHPRREWSVLAQHTRSTNTGRYNLAQYHAADVAAGPLEYQERSDNRARNLETTLQTDYTHPFGEKNSLEAGTKAILRQVSSDYALDTLLQARQSDFAHSARRSNAFDYQQNIAAAYGTYHLAVGKKYALNLGLRLEETFIEGEFSGAGASFSNSYFNLLPNISATRTLKEPGHTLRLSYSRRIQRPNIYYLNPYLNQSAPRSVSYGNPRLSAELGDNLELSYSTFGKTTSLDASLYVRYTGNSIERYTLYNAVLARTESTYGNLATNAAYGLNLYGSWRPTSAWNLGANATFNYSYLHSAALDRTTRLLSINLGLNASWKIDKRYSLQGYGGGGNGGVGLQSRYSGYLYYTLGLKRTFLKDKADLTLNGTNFLTPGREFRNTTSTDQFSSESLSYQYQRQVRLSFSYRFGRLDAGGRRQRRSVRNDDAKGGGSGE